MCLFPFLVTSIARAIDVLDPGGFGAVTITKSISIAADGVIAGVLVSGTNGIVVQVPAGASVTLRGLTIEGLGSGINGIRFLGGGSLQVEHCFINGFTTAGIDFEPNTAATLFVRDSMITNNSGGGVIVARSGGATPRGSVENRLLDRNLFGLRVQADGKINAKNVTASNHSNAGFTSVSGGAHLELHGHRQRDGHVGGQRRPADLIRQQPQRRQRPERLVDADTGGLLTPSAEQRWAVRSRYTTMKQGQARARRLDSSCSCFMVHLFSALTGMHHEARASESKAS